MDLNKLIGSIGSISKEKLKTDSGLKEVIRDLARKNGKSLGDSELNGYVSQFRRMQKTESVGSLLSKLSKKGIKQSDLSKLRGKFKK